MEKLYTLLNTKADKIASLSQEAAEAHLYAICLVSQGKTRDRTVLYQNKLSLNHFVIWRLNGSVKSLTFHTLAHIMVSNTHWNLQGLIYISLIKRERYILRWGF